MIASSAVAEMYSIVTSGCLATIQATHVTRNGYPSSSAIEIPNRGGGGLFDLPALLRKYLPVIPNTYYDIPKHRYPYYDENGSGRLLYGYGGKTLYKYTMESNVYLASEDY